MDVIRLRCQRLDCDSAHCRELHRLKVLETEADTAVVMCLPVAAVPCLESWLVEDGCILVAME